MFTTKTLDRLVILVALCLVCSGDFPQLHRALPGANGKPGYRVTSSHGSKVGNADYSIQNKHGVGADKQTHAEYQQKTMDFELQWTQAALYSLASCTLVGLSGIFPLIVIPLEAGPSLKHGSGSAMLKLLLSFAVGSLLGDVFLHLLPEAWATVHTAEDLHWAHTVVGLWVIVGVLSFMGIEKLFSETEDEENEKADDYEQEEKPSSAESLTESTTHGLNNKTNYNLRSRAKSSTQDHLNGIVHQNGTGNGHLIQNGTAKKYNEEKTIINKNTNNNIHITGYLNLLANFIDNFTHGLAVAGSYLISPKVGLCTTIAILLHEIPHEVGDFAILLRSGFDRWKAAKAQIVTASGGLLGALTALMSESAEKAGDRTAAILPFTAGGFIYIALVTVVPELLKEKCPKESLKQMACVILGIVSMLLVTILFEG